MNLIKHISVLSLATLALVSTTQAKPPENMNKLLKDFEAYAYQTFYEWDVPGAAIAVVSDKRTVLLTQYGVRELGSSKAVDANTIFRLASLSKTMTAGLTGALVDDGKLDWDDYVKTYLPKFALSDSNNTNTLTIRHLLNHTSGLFCPHAYDNLIEDGMPYDKVVSRIKEVDCSALPGKKYAYQNVMFSLMGDITKEATGLSYEDAMRQYIFTPLRMYDTTTTEAGYITALNRATPHVKLRGVQKPGKHKSYYYQVAPAGGVNSSIANMSNWLRAQMGTFPEIISDVNRREVQHRHISTSIPKEIKQVPELADSRLTDVSYGLGWRIFDYMGKSFMYHGGRVGGFSNSIAFMPTEKVGIVILTNSETPVPQILTAKFFDMYLDLPEKDWSKLTLAKRQSPKKPGS